MWKEKSKLKSNILYLMIFIVIFLSSCVSARVSSTDDGSKITESGEKGFNKLRLTAISYMTGNPEITTYSDESINSYEWNEEDCKTESFLITKRENKNGDVTYSSNIDDKYLEKVCIHLLNKPFVSSVMLDMGKYWFSDSIFDTAFLGAILRESKKSSRKEIDSNGLKIKITDYNIIVSYMYINYTIDNNFYNYCNDLKNYADIARKNVEIDYQNKSIYSWFSEIRTRQVKKYYTKQVYHPGYYDYMGYYHAGYYTYENDYYYDTEYYTYYNPYYSLAKAQYWQDEADKDYATYLVFADEIFKQQPFIVVDCSTSYINKMEKIK